MNFLQLCTTVGVRVGVQPLPSIVNSEDIMAKRFVLATYQAAEHIMHSVEIPPLIRVESWRGANRTFSFHEECFRLLSVRNPLQKQMTCYAWQWPDGSHDVVLIQDGLSRGNNNTQDFTVIYVSALWTSAGKQITGDGDTFFIPSTLLSAGLSYYFAMGVGVPYEPFLIDFQKQLSVVAEKIITHNSVFF